MGLLGVERHVLWLAITIAVVVFLWQGAPRHANRKWLLMVLVSMAGETANWLLLVEPYDHDPGPMGDIAAVLVILFFFMWVISIILFTLSWCKHKPEGPETNAPRKLPEGRFFTDSGNIQRPGEEPSSESPPSERDGRGRNRPDV